MADRRPGGAQHIPRPERWRAGGPPPWESASGAGRLLSSAAIAAIVAGRPARRVAADFDGARESAVLVLLHDGPSGAEVLFTRRPMHMRNHRGEISFPGGRMEIGESPSQTALREAWEEVALDPALVTVHGELDHLATFASKSYIVPVVGSVAARPSLVPHASEVDRIFWIGLDDMLQPGTYREEWWDIQGAERQLYFFELDDETVWGATARIVHQLLRLAHGVDEPEQPAI